MLDISPALRAPGAAIPFVHRETLEDTQVLGEAVRFPEPAALTGNYSLVDERLVIRGRLQAEALGACARCLQDVRFPVDIQVEEQFLREDPRARQEEDPWEENLVFSGHKVELGDLIRSLTLLEMPIRFLCGARCAGLPQGAGDKTPDQHDMTPDAEGPFAALRHLLKENQEE